MNVYDFDKTIFSGDSTQQFLLFCFRRHPSLVRYLPRQGWAVLRYCCKRITKTQMKEIIYSCFRGISDIQGEVAAFWKKNQNKIKPWYHKQKQPSDVIISASPQFLLQPICEHLGVTLLASLVDPFTGKTQGKNCYGEEKTKRFVTMFPGAVVEQFYSDSRSDLPMARLAKQAFLVDADTITAWNTAEQ